MDFGASSIHTLHEVNLLPFTRFTCIPVFFFHLAFYSFKFVCFCFFNLYVKSFLSLFPYVLIHFGFLEYSHLQFLWCFFNVSICAPSSFFGCNSSWFQFLLLQYFSSLSMFFIFIVCNTLYSFYCVFVAFYYIIGSLQLFPFVSIFTYISLLDVSFLGFYFLVLLHCRFDSLNFILISFFFFQFKHL